MIDKSKITNLTTSIRNFVTREITTHANTTANSSTKGHVQSATNPPQDVSNTSAIGTDNGYYARADHVHKASFDDLADVPSSFTPASHSHGNLKNDGTVTSNYSSPCNYFAGFDSNYKLFKCNKLYSSKIVNSSALSTIGTSASATQSTINSAINTSLSKKANTADLATVATSGSYNSLSNKPSKYFTQMDAINYNVDINGSTMIVAWTGEIGGQEVTITCTSGEFYEIVDVTGSLEPMTTTSITPTQSVTVTTNPDSLAAVNWRPSTWGLCTFRTKIDYTPVAQTQVNVTGWKTYATQSASNGWNVTIEYNQTHARCIINDPASVSFTTSEQNYTSILTDWWIRPKRPKVFFISGTKWFIIREGNTNIIKQATANSSSTVYVQFDWTHQGVPN